MANTEGTHVDVHIPSVYVPPWRRRNTYGSEISSDEDDDGLVDHGSDVFTSNCSSHSMTGGLREHNSQASGKSFSSNLTQTHDWNASTPNLSGLTADPVEGWGRKRVYVSSNWSKSHNWSDGIGLGSSGRRQGGFVVGGLPRPKDKVTTHSQKFGETQTQQTSTDQSPSPSCGRSFAAPTVDLSTMKQWSASSNPGDGQKKLTDKPQSPCGRHSDASDLRSISFLFDDTLQELSLSCPVGSVDIGVQTAESRSVENHFMNTVLADQEIFPMIAQNHPKLLQYVISHRLH